jgi:hypothetical protein
LADLLEKAPAGELPVAAEVVDWLERIETALASERGFLVGEGLAPQDRKRMMDALGEAFSDYRQTVYARGFSGKKNLGLGRAATLCRTAVEFVDLGIRANRRHDGLFHTYNLLDLTGDGSGVTVGRLQEMLEGQVAVISSGLLEPAEVMEILEHLYASAMYRPDQRSFMLYPERDLPGFLAKNRIPDAKVEEIRLLKDLLAAGDQSLVARDADGVCRFHGDVRSEQDLGPVLADLEARDEWSQAVQRDRDAVLDLFEEVFRHRSYTGRSGVMYGYEGLGCIYWHMVAKLLLAVQETVLKAERDGAAPPLREDLARMYFRVRSGIGYEKTAAEYGAFPMDPYSHTPAGGGAKQPGMTGQVKEEILTRFGELGVHVEDGTVSFRPYLLRSEEFLTESGNWGYFDVTGKARALALDSGSLAFTICQVPVVYRQVAGPGWVHVTFADGTSSEHPGNRLDRQLSADLFSRTGRIEKIQVGIQGHTLCHL